MKKAEKQEFVKKLSWELGDARAIVVIDFQGMATSDMEMLRKGLREVGAKLTVVKNTLLARALQKKEVEGKLQGQSAVVITKEDEIAPLQVIAKVAKEKEKPSFKFGFLGTTFYDAAALSLLSLLPSKNVLYSQLVGAASSPLYAFSYILQANMQNLVYILEKYKSIRKDA
jgi:large subunit ribosomal protein L10